MSLIFTQQYKMALPTSGVVCTYTPPSGQDITVYLARFQDILSQLNTIKNKELARERIKYLIEDITEVITNAKNSATDSS